MKFKVQSYTVLASRIHSMLFVLLLEDKPTDAQKLAIANLESQYDEYMRKAIILNQDTFLKKVG